MLQAILELAKRLGRTISESPQAQKLRQARLELDQQKDVLDLLQQYQEQAQKLQKLEHENQPVEVDDKHKLRDLHDKLIASEVFKRFTSAQVDYVDLMRQVNDTLRKELAEVEAPREH